MRNELEQELYNIDPIFFKEAISCLTGEMNEMNTCMAFGCECGDGWFEPLKSFVKKVKILNDLGKQYNVQFICNQLKEKFGTLRVYSSIYKINNDEEFKSGHYILSDMYDDALRTCEDECSKVCEICGASGGNNNENIIETSGWISYICKACARKQTEASTKHYDETHKDNEFYGIDRITLFNHENEFLNIYHNHSFIYNDETYTSIIHAYFSIVDPENANIYKGISISKTRFAAFLIESLAKKFGYKLDNFELLKDIVKAKFSDYYNKTIRKDLLLTKNKMLIDMNQLHENELGYCYCKECKDIEKQNLYGKILMEVRNELLETIEERFDSLEDAKKFISEMNLSLNLFEAKHSKQQHIKCYFVTNKSTLEIPDQTLEQLR